MVSQGPEKRNGKYVTRRDFLKAGGAVIASAVLFNSLSSCTTSGTTKSTSTSTPVATTATTSTNGTATPLTPKYGGVLKQLINQSPANIGWPFEGQGLGTADECLEPLLRADNKGNIFPWLAESYKIADDMKSMTFNLRKGVKFHDGSDFNADIAKWNLDNYISGKMESYWASVDKIDDYTIKLNFTQWVSYIPSSFCASPPLICMVSKAAFDKYGVTWMRSHPVGTGPFKFVSYTQDVSLKYSKNPDYWVKGRPYLDGLESTFCGNDSTMRMVAASGEGDVLVITDVKNAADYVKMGFNIRLDLNANGVLVPDSAHADSPWANSKVREAVEYAIDREGIAKAFGFGYMQAPYQIPPRNCAIYDPNFPLARQYDPEKAKQLLDEAGYTGNPRFETTLIVCIGLNQDICVALQDNLAKVGIKLNVDYPDLGKWITYMGPFGNWHNAAIIMPLPTHDPTFFEALRFSDQMWGKNWLRTPEITEGYKTALAAATVDTKLIRSITDAMTKEALVIPVSEIGRVRVDRPYVVAEFAQRGFTPNDKYEEWWLNK